MFHVVNDTIAVGGDCDQTRLEMIAKEGYQAVLDLCAPPEPKRLETTMVESLGLSCLNLPITPANVNAETLNAFLQTIDAAPKPLYIRCASGVRASIFMILALIEKEDADYFALLNAFGIQPKPDCPINDFAVSHLKSKSKLS